MGEMLVLYSKGVSQIAYTNSPKSTGATSLWHNALAELAKHIIQNNAKPLGCDAAMMRFTCMLKSLEKNFALPS